MKMRNAEKRIRALGWKDGTVAEFLKLTPEESALIEIKLALSRKLRERRRKRMTQAQLAQKTSFQPVARGQGGDGGQFRVNRLAGTCYPCYRRNGKGRRQSDCQQLMMVEHWLRSPFTIAENTVVTGRKNLTSETANNARVKAHSRFQKHFRMSLGDGQ